MFMADACCREEELWVHDKCFHTEVGRLFMTGPSAYIGRGEFLVVLRERDMKVSTK